MQRFIRILAISIKTLFLIIIFFTLFFLSACTHPSRIEGITASSEHLFVVTRDWSIKIYDLKSHKLLGILDIPEKVHDVHGYGKIKSIFEDHGDLLIQANTVSFHQDAQSNIYLMQGNDVRKIGSLPPQNIIVGIDEDNIYAIEYRGSYKDPYLIGYRYDKEMQEQKNHHFSEYPEFVIADIWEDEDYYWYACVHNPAPVQFDAPVGKMYLLFKSKHSGNLELFEIEDGGIGFSYSSIALTGDKSFIWIFGQEEKIDKRKGKKIFRFAKTVKDIDKSVNISFNLNLIETKEADDSSPFLWFSSNRPFSTNFTLLNKDTIEIKPLNVKIPLDAGCYNNECPKFLDKDNLWTETSLYDEKTHYCIPYLVRISKTSADYELISLDPKLMQIFKGIERGMVTGALPLALVIIFLSINILVVIFGFFNVRDMRGRWITGVIQILAIFFVLSAPSFIEKLIGAGGFWIAFILAGSASVLFSRTLAYMVKPIKTKGILWILTILFSVFAPVLFALLILAIFRFSSMGEEGLGIAILTFYGGCIVGAVAFVVNIVVNVMDKANDK